MKIFRSIVVYTFFLALLISQSSKNPVYSNVDNNINLIKKFPSLGINQFTNEEVKGFDCNTVEDIPLTECQALVDLYLATDGTNWKNNDGWLNSNIVDDWHGISVLGNHVVAISLQSNQLLGPLPESLGNLSNLESLNLIDNQLSGSFPISLGNLSNLVTLGLGYNFFIGYIPESFGNLSHLTTLDLGWNLLSSAPFPEQIKYLANLQLLNLDANGLTGEIPDWLGSLTNLQYLSLASNDLSGTIPESLSYLTNLTFLNLNYNQLAGTIPEWFGNFTNLETLILGGNQFSGPIPESFGNLSNLVNLSLHLNQLTGTIPDWFGNLTNLASFALSGNQFTGTIPDSLGNLSNLTHLLFSDNQLTGNIPESLGNLTNLIQLSLHDNQLTGAIPDSISNCSSLIYLHLNNNQLSGQFPVSIGNLSNLTHLSLNNNQISGLLPATLGNLTFLRDLYFSDNLLTGSIPLSFINLDLSNFIFSNTTLCEPNNPDYIIWKESVDYYLGTDLICTNQNPVAYAGEDQTVITLSFVTLNGSGSDPENNLPLSYQWTQTGGPSVTLSDSTSPYPSFTSPDDPTLLTFSLVVTDSYDLSSFPNEVTITVNNQVPIANAGEDQSVDTQSTVNLNGSGTDPDNDLPLSYHWTQTGGQSVILSNTTLSNPSFIAPDDPGILTFSLVVTDSFGFSSSPDEVTITVNNQTPFADAGEDQSVNTLSTVNLNGNGSDPDNDLPLSYQWTQTGGPSVTISNSTLYNPSFSAPDDPGVLTFSLVVTDSFDLSSATDDVTITVNNQAPIADAGQDQLVDRSSFVTLSGIGIDPDNDLPISYQWTQTGGPTITLSNSTSPTSNFTAPDDPAVVTFSLIVVDSFGLSSSPDEVTITVNNQAPIADAGDDQSVNTLFNVNLNGNGSDPENDFPLSYQWTQTGGPSITLSNSFSPTPSFIAPDDPGILTFSLVVTDSFGFSSSPDEVTITVNNQTPFADAGKDQEIFTKSSVTLDGSGIDLDGDLPISYFWSQVSGTYVALDDPSKSNPSFISPSNPANIIFSLTVTDSLGLSSKPDEVEIVIKNQAPVAFAGEDQTSKTNTLVVLDGSNCYDPDNDLPLSLLWTQTSGLDVILDDPTAIYPTFTAPDDPGVLTFSLVVTDSFDLSSATDEVTITIINQAPIADAGDDQNVETLSTVNLNGNGSDPDNDLPLSYQWTQTGGRSVTLNNSTVFNPSFTAPDDSAVLTFSLVVIDSFGLSSSFDDVEITVVIPPSIEYKIYLPLLTR